MKARGVVLLLLLVLAALLGWLFHSRFQWARESTWAGFQGEALDNDFLAAQRLLRRTGHPATCLQGLPDQLPPTDAVLVLPRRSQTMAPAEAARICAWVDAGGLLLAAAAESDDPLFTRFGVRLVPSIEDDLTRFTLGGQILRLDLGDHTRVQVIGTGTASGIVQRDLGKGTALLCADLECLRNGRLASFDHADFICAVAAQRPGGVWLITRASAGTAWGWAWRHGWPLVIALAALGLVALWAAAPRFGPLLPDPDPARRSFLEHLDACARYQWRIAQGRPLLAAARAAFQQRLVQRHPGWAALEAQALCLRLAQHTGLGPERIQRALLFPAAHAAGFLEAIQTLHLLGRKL